MSSQPDRDSIEISGFDNTYSLTKFPPSLFKRRGENEIKSNHWELQNT
jgi:hypothetical protein